MIKNMNTQDLLKKLIEDEARKNAEKELFLRQMPVGESQNVEIPVDEEEKKRQLMFMMQKVK